MAQLLDLQAEQCPHVMSIVRTAFLRAVDGGFEGEVEIRTIEQSVPDKLKVFLAQLDTVTIESTTSRPIDDTRRAELLATEDITEEQLSVIDSEQWIKVKVQS